MKCSDCDGTGEKFVLPKGNPFNMRLPQLAQALRKVRCYHCEGIGEVMPRMTDSPMDVAMSLSKQELARRLIDAEQMIKAERIVKAELFKELEELQKDMAARAEQTDAQIAMLRSDADRGSAL